MDVKSISDLESKEVMPGFNGKFIHSEEMTHAYWVIKTGAELPEHHHIHEQVANILEGEFEFTVNGETRICKAGDVLVLKSNVPHSGRAITDCRILDVFAPRREDLG
ncbi:MAG: cupin domain-containing protein [Bacteroidota bacterium]